MSPSLRELKRTRRVRPTEGLSFGLTGTRSIVLDSTQKFGTHRRNIVKERAKEYRDTSIRRSVAVEKGKCRAAAFLNPREIERRTRPIAGFRRRRIHIQRVTNTRKRIASANTWKKATLKTSREGVRRGETVKERTWNIIGRQRQRVLQCDAHTLQTDTGQSRASVSRVCKECAA